jgi:hypothetical protein
VFSTIEPSVQTRAPHRRRPPHACADGRAYRSAEIYSGTPRSCADVAAGLSAGNRTASWHGRFVRKVPTDPAGPLAAAHTRAAETTHSCGRFHSAAEGGRMRYSGDGRALVPRTDSSVRTSVPVGTRAGRRRRARVDLAAAHAREPRALRMRSRPRSDTLPRRAFARSVRRGEHGGL